MNGLWRLHNACNTAGAWQDWQTLKNVAETRGRKDLADKFQPALKSGWRTIDKRIAALRKALSECEEAEDEQ